MIGKAGMNDRGGGDDGVKSEYAGSGRCFFLHFPRCAS